MSDQLKAPVGDLLGGCERRIEELETLPARHLDHDKERRIAREPSRKEDFTAYFKGPRRQGFVGDAVAPTTPLDVGVIEASIEELRQAGAPTSAFAELRTAMATLEEARVLYEERKFAALPFEKWEHAHASYCKAALAAVEAADESFKKWNASRPREARTLGTTIGDQVFLNSSDVAEMSGTTEDAARKWIREKGFEQHPFGRRKYVLLRDLLAAVDKPCADPSD